MVAQIGRSQIFIRGEQDGQQIAQQRRPRENGIAATVRGPWSDTQGNNDWAIKTRLVCPPIRERLHEDNERVLLGFRQAEAAYAAGVHVGG